MHILLVDDHAVVRQGYCALLTMMLPETQVDEAENAQQALKILGQPGRITKRWPELKIIFFSMFDEPSVVQRAMQTGAMGYLSKRSSPDTMIDAIKTVRAGKRYIEHSLAIQLATHQMQENEAVCDQLTQREFDVFIGIAKGLDRTQLANALNVSSKTISNTLTQLKSKLQIHTNTELVHLAIEQGYLKVAV